MLHQPAPQQGHDAALSFKMRLGVVMFILYLIIYAAFVAINVVSAQSMELPVIFGLNLAVVFGFGLILFAFILAIFYNWLCTKQERKNR